MNVNFFSKKNNIAIRQCLHSQIRIIRYSHTAFEFHHNSQYIFAAIIIGSSFTFFWDEMVSTGSGMVMIASRALRMHVNLMENNNCKL